MYDTLFRPSVWAIRAFQIHNFEDSNSHPGDRYPVRNARRFPRVSGYAPGIQAKAAKKSRPEEGATVYAILAYRVLRNNF